MARSAQAAVAGEMTVEEQAQLDEMRAADNVPEQDTGQQETPQDTGATEAQDEGQEPQQADDRPRMVPHAALHEERERRKETERQLAELTRRSEERINMLLQRVTQPQSPQAQQQAPALPEPDKDPVGHILGRIGNIEQALPVIAQALQGMGQQNQQAAAEGQLMQAAMAMEQDFANKTPDYQQAVAYLADQRHKELEALGWVNVAERQALIRREALQLAATAIQSGHNPGAYVYNMAKIRGFQAPAPQQQAQQVDPAERLQNANRGQQQMGRSLGNVRGNAPPPLTAQRLWEMSDSEFIKMMETKEGRELLGV